jgi:hypothetical protein
VKKGMAVQLAINLNGVTTGRTNRKTTHCDFGQGHPRDGSCRNLKSVAMQHENGAKTTAIARQVACRTFACDAGKKTTENA